MSNAPFPLPELDEEAAELAALDAAVAKSRADERGVPHAEMRDWLLQIAAGNFDAEAPVSHKLRVSSGVRTPAPTWCGSSGISAPKTQ